jgi:hypothetical protein
VVSVKGAEGAEHGPAGTQLLICVFGVSADVRADHRDLVDAGEAHHSGNRDTVFVPLAEVITQPVTYFCTCTGERAAGDNHWPKTRTTGKHCISARRTHHLDY